jgi:hypothetical protein
MPAVRFSFGNRRKQSAQRGEKRHEPILTHYVSPKST